MALVREEESLDTHADTEKSVDYERGVDEFGHTKVVPGYKSSGKVRARGWSSLTEKGMTVFLFRTNHPNFREVDSFRRLIKS